MASYLTCMQNEKGGSGLLPLLFSTIGGAAFLFSFYNLTQFTAAKSAADQAARRAARCLTATDPETACRSVIADPGQTFQETEWFGYPRIDGPSEVQVDTYRYSAQVYREQYGARYNSYEVNTANHNVEWDEKTVRPSRFIGLLNSYAVLRADLRGNFERQRSDGTYESRSCFVYDRVEVAFGTDFSSPETYVANEWCQGVNFRVEDPACADMDSTWVPSSPERDFPCRLVLPERDTMDPAMVSQPWLLLGGSPVCHTDANDLARYGVTSRVGLNETELNAHYLNIFGSEAAPGNVGRPFPITPGRQFVVITVYSCNPEQFLSRVRESVRSTEDLLTYFTTYPSIDIPFFQNIPGGDFVRNDDPRYTNAFLYNSAEGMSYIAPQDWTYLAWHRQTGEQWRTLTRKVCEWLPFEEAAETWEEFLPIGDPRNPFTYSPNPSGVDLMSLPELVFADVPECLQSERVPAEMTRHTCGNTRIAGQPGAFEFCDGWSEQEEQRHKSYESNLSSVLGSNADEAWSSFEKLPVDGFVTLISPRWSQELSNPVWEFSWTHDRYLGNVVTNVNAVRPRGGFNPKELPPDRYLSQYRRHDKGERRNERRSALLEAIIAQEGAGYANLQEAGDISALFDDFKVSEETVQINGVWPFVNDSAGVSQPQARPYFPSGQAFDYNLDCNPVNTCSSGGVPPFSTLEEALRFYANNALSDADLTDPSYAFEFNEVQDRTVTMNANQVSSAAFPPCTQFRSLCGSSGNRGQLESLGRHSSIPPVCRNGEYLDCSPRYETTPEPQRYTVETNRESARLLALAEVRKLMPGAVFCNSGVTSGCVRVDIGESGSEAQVDVAFIAPLTSPFTELFSARSITIRATKRELIESERLRQ
jgi:hypothetical protein